MSRGQYIGFWHDLDEWERVEFVYMRQRGYDTDIALQSLFNRRQFNKSVRDAREIGWLTAAVALFVLAEVLITIFYVRPG